MEKLLNRLAEIKTNLTQEVVKDEELKAIVEKNANEVIHTGNTGYGKELVNLDVFTNNIYEGIAKKSKFVPMFSQ
jgi:activator of 2-hydroxyglutaryl-CoA dehydratase